MSWNTVRGHSQIVSSFASARRKGRLGHAYLFVGPRGVGKHTVARELAKAVLCERSGDGMDACDRCGSCALIAAGTHPDLIVAARPEELQELSIDTIRELIEHLSLKPARGGRKVAILDDADDFNETSANAFLKTLEEPPPHSLLLLIGGANTDQQIATILSRCQVVRFAPLPHAEVATYLQEHGVAESDRIDRLVRVSGGSIGQAVELNDPDLWEFRKSLLAVLFSGTIEPFDFALRWTQFLDQVGKEAGKRRRRTSLVLRLLIGLLQDATRLLMGVPPLVADASEATVLEAFARRIGQEKLFDWTERAVEADRHNDRKVQLELMIEAFADYLGR